MRWGARRWHESSRWLHALPRALTELTPAAAHNAWAAILGFTISELWGNLPRIVTDTDGLFDTHLRTVLRGMGFRAER
ncbi:hypothetical protein OG203_37480 [Nocardia sp. NBC_01499]|uniref:hypothetical protein n=1 Tax=Nocardia sp. NBC_01499 TaxID=2903597 RepID=UPI00386A3172